MNNVDGTHSRRFAPVRHLALFAGGGVFGALVVALILLYAHAGTYGFNVLLRRGATIWVTVSADDPRLSPAMRLALEERPPAAAAGPLAWRAIDDGFEVGELPVIVDGGAVDRVLLARIDPRRFRFIVRNAPAGNRELGDWMTALDALLVINGSYFLPDGTPDTPVLSDGTTLGPHNYKAKHGAFVASASFVGIRDLAREDWRAAFSGAQDAMVSYPLLIAADGSSRATGGRHWLANRSFVGQDHAGRIILGTTTDAFFSLDRLAQFLRDAPLDLALALNLDGGPVACQGIALNGYKRDVCGGFELAERDGELKLWRPLLGTRRVGLPMVLAVLRK